MLKLRPPLLMITLLTLALPATATPIVTENSELNFRLTTPTKISVIQKQDPSFEMKSAIFTAAEGTDQYALRVLSYPRRVEVTARQQQKFFDAFRQRTVQQLKGAIVFERDVSLDDHLGREFTIRSTNIKGLEGIPVRFTQRIFAVDTRVYTLTTVARQHGLRHERFFDSFSLIKKVPAPEGLRYETRRVSHANNVAYTSRLPARHRLLAIEEKSAPVEWSEDISELLYSRAYKVSDENLTFIVGTLALPDGAVTKANAEALFNQARVKALGRLNLVSPKMNVELDKNGISRRLRVSGTQNIGGKETSIALGLFLFKDRFYQVLVLGDAALVALDGQKFLASFEAHEMEE